MAKARMTWSEAFYVARRSIDASISEQDVRSFLYKEQHSDATVHDVVKQMRVFSRVANPLPRFIPALKGCDDYEEPEVPVRRLSVLRGGRR